MKAIARSTSIPDQSSRRLQTTKAQYVVLRSASPPFGSAEKLGGRYERRVAGNVVHSMPAVFPLTGPYEVQYARTVQPREVVSEDRQGHQGGVGHDEMGDV